MDALTIERVDGVAVLVFDLPDEPVNKLSARVKSEFEDAFGSIASDESVSAVVVISGKPDIFIAGADIDEFVALRTREEAETLSREGQAMLDGVANFPKPVVVAINGACLGGGLEFALAAHYRVASSHPKTQLGLPEVQLGIIPGAGGCQRLPRLIGLRKALEMILTGRSIRADRARRLGLVDALVPNAILREVAVSAARRLAESMPPRRAPGGFAAALLERNSIGRRIVLRQAAKTVRRRTGGHYPAPLAALEAVREGLSHGLAAGLRREAQLFGELAVGDVSRKLVQIFFATTALKKDPGESVEPSAVRTVERLGVVGAGFMGAAIGGVAVAQAGVDVRFRDADLEGVGNGLRGARRLLERRKQRRRISRFEYQRLRSLLSGTTDYSGFAARDLVIEAVFEDADVKRGVFAELEDVVREECVLASNTSTIPIARLQEGARHPERILGMHFFSPVDKMPLLEVIRGPATAPWAVQDRDLRERSPRILGEPTSHTVPQRSGLAACRGGLYRGHRQGDDAIRLPRWPPDSSR
jgi:3-hydroxyacyl-CoA dehydrogenase/enoyl-CoA hydratase/3-hydroxybutyryl-CoA epimerase